MIRGRVLNSRFLSVFPLWTLSESNTHPEGVLAREDDTTTSVAFVLHLITVGSSQEENI